MTAGVPRPEHRNTRKNVAVTLRRWLYALTYDRQMAKVEAAGLGALRQGLLAQARGRVLEIGGGTGANLALYGPEVESLTITEPDSSMLHRLERKVREHAPIAKVQRASAEDLPYADGSFDVAVSTLVLCGVDDQPRALAEVRRVLRPQGRLLFLEHVRSDDAHVARRQGEGRTAGCGPLSRRHSVRRWWGPRCRR